MKTRTMLTSALMTAVLLAISVVPLRTGFAQNSEGRWALGFRAGGNMWFNDYDKRTIGPGGEVMLRYGISRGFSAGLLVGYEELKSKQDVLVVSPFSYLKLHAMPASFVGWIHLAPGKTINPYIYGGFGAMIYKRLTGGSVYVPDEKFITTVHVPFGVGLEIFPSANTSIVLDGGYRVTDAYTDAVKGKLDGYATVKAGINVYLGTSAAEREALAEAEARRVKALAQEEAKKVKALADAEALRVKELAANEARRLKELADAEARRLAEQRTRDTLIVLEKGKTVILTGVNFETNKATLTTYSENILERALTALRASPDLNVLIVGHTDNVGSAAYNKKLSLRRAETVMVWLINRGIAAKRLSVAGKGFDEPIDTNSSEEGRLNNRRIEFRVLE